MPWEQEQLQRCKTEDEVHHLIGTWVARAFREAEKKKLAWNQKAQNRINEIREQTYLPPLKKP